MTSVATLLAGLRDGPLTLVEPNEIAELRAAIEEAVGDVVAGGPADQGPLRLPKQRLTDAFNCEGQLLARLTPTEAMTLPLLIGRLLDACVHHHVFGGEPGEPLTIALDVLAADEATGVLQAVDDLSSTEREELSTELALRVDRLRQGWGPIDQAWWPRCESAAAVVLADGAVVASALFDVEFGGGSSGLPGVILEVKSGALRSGHRDDVFWYALLAALRDGVAPAAVITWAAAEDVALIEPVYLGTLEAAARRAVEGLTRLAELAAGRPPELRPGRWCAWCSLQSTCPAADVNA